MQRGRWRPGEKGDVRLPVYKPHSQRSTYGGGDLRALYACTYAAPPRSCPPRTATAARRGLKGKVRSRVCALRGSHAADRVRCASRVLHKGRNCRARGTWTYNTFPRTRRR
ncbi:hypothetical protein C8Q78DRAFT_49099 [Trametes maxima]|nr:hypothetical protein C8Q78DRAFT_49099 [Trametes maxima]